MKRLTLLFIVLLSVSGCALFQNQKLNFEACMADPTCKDGAEAWKDRAETASVIVASAIPVPGAAAVPKVIGYIALGIAALIGGNTLRKKKEEIPV